MKVVFRVLLQDIDGYEQISVNNVPGYFPDIFIRYLDVAREDITRYFCLNSDLDFYLPSDKDIDFEYIQNIVLEKLKIDLAWGREVHSAVHLLIDGEFIYIEDLGKKLEDVLSYYSHQDMLQVFWVFSVYQGDVFREGNIRYYMHSNENNHNEPHVHVIVDGQYSASIDLLDDSIICGNIPSGKRRKILSTVSSRKKELIDYWNKHTNGIFVDIDYAMGTTKLVLR